MMTSKWFLPGFSLFLGVLFLAAFWIGDDLRTGIYSLIVMAVVSAGDPARRAQRDGARSPW